MREPPQPAFFESETVAAARSSGRADLGSGKIIDADYVTLDRHEGRAQPAEPVRSPQTPPAGIDVLRREEAPPPFTARGSAGFWLFGLTLAAAAFWVSGGHALVGRSPPPLASDVRDPIRIEDFTSRIERRGDRAALLIDGEVANAGAVALAMPALVISISAGGGRTTRYILGTNGAAIAAGGRFAFASRLEAPKDGATSVTVSFQDAAD